MNEKKHTPGTWKVQERKIEGEFVTTTHIVSQDGSHIVIVGPCNIEANASLIAAGPEMLEALQEIIAAADGDGWNQIDAGFTKARAAIAKAEGGKL